MSSFRQTLVLTAYDDAFAPLGDITTPLIDRYATKHRYDYRLRRTKPYGMPPLWWKLVLVREALREYERVFWLDADMLITNPDFSPDNLTAGISLSRDWGADAVNESHFSCGAYLACHDALDVFDWAEHYASRFRTSLFGDQDALRYLFETPLRRHFQILPRRALNAVPQEIHPSVVEPWQPGDFAAHLTMIPLAERVTLAHKLLEQTS